MSRLRSLIGVAIAFFNLSLPTFAAENIKFNYGLLGFSIKVDDLALFAENGTITPELNFYLRRLSPKQQEQFRVLLRSEYKVDPVLVYRFTHTSVGEKVFKRFGEFLQISYNINGFYGLRASLIKGASDPQGVSLISCLRHFPKDLQLNLEELLKLVHDITDVKTDTRELLQQLQEYQQKSTVSADITQLPDLSQQGKITVNKQTLIFNDNQRQRELVLDLYLPEASNTPNPLIIVSNGLGAKRERFEDLARYLASYGFAVIILDHPGSDRKRQKAFLSGLYRDNFDATEFSDRPLDISFILDKMEESPFKDQLNTENVGIFGYSFGTTTALSLTGANITFEQLEKDCKLPLNLLNISMLYQCRALESPKNQMKLVDKRIKASFLFVPFGYSLFGKAQLQQVKIPMLWQTVEEDFLTSPILEQIPAFHKLGSKDKYLVISENLPHTPITFSQQQSTETEKISQVSKQYQNVLSLSFFKIYLAQDLSYVPYLDPAYMKILSKAPYNLYLTSQDLE